MTKGITRQTVDALRSPCLTVWFLAVLTLSRALLCGGEPSNALVFETATFRYVMSHAAENQAFVDRATGTDYLQDHPPSPAAWVRVNGQTVLATSAVRTEHGFALRFGDMQLNRGKWPDGWEHWRRIVARLHAEGIGSIFHTYAFFIDKQSKYVSPVPDSRLDAFRTLTLAAPLDLDATEIIVSESTANLSTVTGFFEHNSVVLHLGDELITFSGFSREAPWKLTGIQRGALGTQAAIGNLYILPQNLQHRFPPQSSRHPAAPPLCMATWTAALDLRGSGSGNRLKCNENLPLDATGMSVRLRHGA